jgi:hypothetical protein
VPEHIDLAFDIQANCADAAYRPPGFQDDSGLKKGTEEFPVQALVTQLVVEAFNVSVLPWGTRGDLDRLDLLLGQPVHDGIGDKLWPIVASEMLRSSVTGYGGFEHP